MNLGKFKLSNRGLYWGLIFTFALLYLCVGFVSTLHSITFFQLANTMWLAILLGLTYEVGQAAVLFSILMSKKNKESYLSWALMLLLTALQVTANVYASFKFMATSGSNDWQYWQKAILFGVQAENAETYQMIISWIAGALLPIVALGMTALVAQNIKFMDQESEKKTEEKEPEKEPEKPEEQKPEEKDIKNEEIVPLDIQTQTKIVDAQPSSFIVPDENIPINNDKIEVKIDPSLKKKIKKTIKKEAKIPDKYEQKFGPEFTSTMAEIKEEIKKEKEPPKKKPGRPPKQKEQAVEVKKEKELLPKEEVEVPQKAKRIINPLKTKGKKIKPVKNLKELEEVPSTGDKIIQIIETINKDKDKESINNDIQINLEDPEVAPSQNKVPYIDGGVEVVDVKAVPKPDEVKKNESASQ